MKNDCPLSVAVVVVRFCHGAIKPLLEEVRGKYGANKVSDVYT